MPLIATALITKFNGSWMPAAVYLMVLGIMSMICVALVKTKPSENDKNTASFVIEEVNIRDLEPLKSALKTRTTNDLV